MIVSVLVLGVLVAVTVTVDLLTAATSHANTRLYASFARASRPSAALPTEMFTCVTGCVVVMW